MRSGLITFSLVLSLFVHGQNNTLLKKIHDLKDSVKVGNMVIYNAFKYQVLAHENNQYDSALIVDKVYKPHPYLWDSCLAQIFGDAGKRFKQNGMVAWNKTLFENQPGLFQKLDTLLLLSFDSLFSAHLKGITQLTGYKPKGKWILYLGPHKDLSMLGGCSVNGMAIDLAHPQITTEILTQAAPHEFEHMVFEELRKNDPDWGTDLGATIDEGLACYFTYEYFNRQLPMWQVTEQMTKEQFQWYLDHEKEIFEKSLPYFETKDGKDKSFTCNCKAGGCKKLFPDAPKTICYFLGFRIVEAYTKKHGKNSWTDAYKIPMRQLLKESGYAEYIRSLKN